MAFKKGFVWGAATASYQVEGAAFTADKGLNIWDYYSNRFKEKFYNGQNGNIACDHYNRFKEDVSLMRDICLNAYRFSVNWARLLPEGRGKLSEDGLRFYNGLIDALLENGITPYLTLYHWDYPYELYKQGGWLNDDSPFWFEEYAQTVAKLFGDRVKHFFTVNEPQVLIGCGYCAGTHPPFISNRIDGVRAGHNLLKGAGLAFRTIKSIAGECKIGIAMVGEVKMPLSDSDIGTARREMFDFKGTLFSNSWFSDPVFFGHYPENYQSFFEFGFKQSDMDIIKTPLDFYAVNIYTGKYVTANPDGSARYVVPSPNTPLTAMGWDVVPDCMYWGPRFFYERYGKPIIISENGVALTEWKESDGTIEDSMRIDFIRKYLKSLLRAHDEGVPIDGYFYWSLMDNFEWVEGYSKRFGLIYVDYETQQRIKKKSAGFYRQLILSDGGIL